MSKPAYKNQPQFRNSLRSNQLLFICQRRDAEVEAMLSELECGICYRPYNVGRRCPRQLSCKHSFCQSCLVTLARSVAAERQDSHSESRIFCAFCRHATELPEAQLKENFPVDEDALERVLKAGTPEGSDGEDEEEEEEEENPDLENQSKSETVPRSRRGRLWRSMKRLCSKVTGQSRRGCITDAEMRDLALMSCYMM